ncbi:MAG: glycosyltransferase family 2 protein [Planctomycetes bacterium]|nr:glycosyltransferase family 2 protein [Planctomycetota bacterium]
MPGVSLIIPNRDGEEYLRDCLDAIAEQTLPPLEVIVVDDASVDSSIAMLEKEYPGIRLLKSGDGVAPRGFAATVNTGIKASTGEYIALLNNDTKPEARWLEEMVTAMEQQPRAASCASRMLHKDGKNINAVGLIFNANGTCGALGDGELDDERFDKNCEVFGPSGGAALWRKSALDKIGLFDEDFFAYWEDADLSYRARAAGFISIYAPKARVLHLEGGCKTLQRYDKVRLRIRNGCWFAFCNLPLGTLFRRFYKIAWAMEYRYFFKYGLRPWKVECRSFWKAIMEVELSPRVFFKKRKERREKQIVADLEITRWLGCNPFAE